MTNSKLPGLTIGLCLFCVLAHFMLPNKEALYFSSDLIFQGQLWRAITGHFIHADLSHLFWNCVGLGILGYLLESHSKKALVIALLGGIASVNLLLLSPLSGIELYCGLSGALNTLLVMALALQWEQSRSPFIPVLAIGCMLKILIEMSFGTSLFTEISWPPYVPSHLAGFIGGIAILTRNTARGQFQKHAKEPALKEAVYTL